MRIEDLPTKVGEWLRGEGPRSHIVISSRIRLARNIKGFHFLNKIPPDERKDLEEFLREIIKKIKINGNPIYVNLRYSSPLDRLFLLERHLISREHANGEGDRGVIFGSDEMVSIMTNEEDHLRVQVMRSGLELEEVWREISRIDRALEAELPFAYSVQFGYLTACPTNLGTGMRVSVMLHLPGLVMTKQIEKVFNSAAKINFAVRGLYGEGTQAYGDFYQISNQCTLGKSEEEVIEEFKNVIPNIIEYEEKVREKLLEDNRRVLEDKVWRAYGLLQNARSVSSEETMGLLSIVRMGVNLRLVKGIDISRINELFIFTQPAHLQKLKGKELSPQERDAARADLIRGKI